MRFSDSGASANSLVAIWANDLFNQNRSFTHIDTSTGYMNLTNNVLSRYYSVKFVYNIRSFGGGVTASNIDQLNDRGGRGHRGGRF